jgi:hypothetical protein
MVDVYILPQEALFFNCPFLTDLCRRGFALFSALNGLRIHPLLRFLKAKGNFAVCGRRQGLLALDLGRFFCKKSSAKKLQKGFATSSPAPDGCRNLFAFH